MNKLLLDKDNDLNNIVIDSDTDIFLNLENIETDINFFITENICVNITEISKYTKNSITCKIDNSSKVLYNKVGIDSNDDIDIKLGEDSYISINTSLINNKNIEYKENIIHSKNSTSYITNHGINSSIDNLKFIVDVVVDNKSINSISNQENKIININCGKSYIYPNLIVDNKEVNLSHSAYIGDFNKESIFYLKSRGISEQESRKILLKGFLLEKLNIDDDTKEKIINFIKE